MKLKRSISLMTAIMLMLSVFTPLSDIFKLDAEAASNGGRFSLISEASRGYGYITFGAGTDCSGFKIYDSNTDTTKRAFCIQHYNETPYEGPQNITDYYEWPNANGQLNINMLKALYYGYAGPEQWSGFNNYTSGYPYQRSGSYSVSYANKPTMAGIYITSLTLSKYYANQYDYSITNFDNYITSAATPPYGLGYNDYTNNKTLSSSLSGSTIKSETLTFKVDVKYGRDSSAPATLTMPSNVTGYNKTTNKSAKPGGKLTVYNGDKIYFTAPTSLAGKSTTISGTVPRLYYYRTYDTTYYRQDIATLESVSGGSLSLKVNWQAPAYLSITKRSTGDYTYGMITSHYNLNATYGIYSNSACTNLVKKITTDNSGKSSNVQLDPGTYYLKEITPPADFYKNTEVSSFTITAGKTTSLTGSNTYKALDETPITGDLKVTKSGYDRTNSLAGAQFRIFYNPTTVITNLKVTPINYNQNNKVVYSGGQGNTIHLATVEITDTTGNNFKVISVNNTAKIGSKKFTDIISVGDTKLENLPKGYYAVVETQTPTSSHSKLPSGNSTSPSGSFPYDVSTDIKKLSSNRSTASFSLYTSISEEKTDEIKLYKDVDYEDANLNYSYKYTPVGAKYGVFELNSIPGKMYPKNSFAYEQYDYLKKLITGVSTRMSYSIYDSDDDDRWTAKKATRAIGGLDIYAISDDDEEYTEFTNKLINLYENGSNGQYIPIYRKALMAIPMNGGTLNMSKQIVGIAVMTSKGIFILPRLRYYSSDIDYAYPTDGSWISNTSVSSANKDGTSEIALGSIFTTHGTSLNEDGIYPNDFVSVNIDGKIYYFYAPVSGSGNSSVSTIDSFVNNSSNAQLPYFDFRKDATLEIAEQDDRYVGVVSAIHTSTFDNEVGDDHLTFSTTSTDYDISNTIFYAKELVAPALYELDTTPITLTTDEDGTGIFIFSASDTAKMDPVNINIQKESTSSNATLSLEGTIFEVRYYNGQYNNISSLPDECTAVWYLDTKQSAATKKYISRMWPDYITSDPDFANKSSDFYYDVDGLPALPAGTITIREVKAAEGFELDSGTVKDQNGVVYNMNDRTFIGQIKLNSNNKLELFAPNNTIGTGTISFTNAVNDLDLNVSNAPENLYFELEKVLLDDTNELTENPGKNISFKITRYIENNGTLTNGLNYRTITTDANGKYVSANDKVSLEAGYVYKFEEVEDSNNTKYQVIEPLYYRVSGQIKALEIPTKDDEDQDTTITKNSVVFTVDKLNVSGTTINNTIESVEVDTRSDFNNVHLFSYDFGTMYNYPVPSVSTTEYDANTGVHISSAEGNVTIKDTVEWKHLEADKDWVIKGILMEKRSDGTVIPFKDHNGSYVLSHSSVIRPVRTNSSQSKYELTGSTDLTFTFNAVGCEGKTFVVYEYVFEGNSTTNLNVTSNDVSQILVNNNVYRTRDGYVTHADKDDIEQTGYIPKIGTTAQDKTSGTKLVYSKNNATITDTVSYKNLEVTPADTITGRYVMVGKLVDTNTDAVIQTVSRQFKPTTKDGSIDMDFNFNAANYKGHTLVVYEYLYLEPNASEDAVHVRLNNDIHQTNITTVNGNGTAQLYRSTKNESKVVTKWDVITTESPILLTKHEDKTDVGQTVYIPDVSTQVAEPVINDDGTYTVTDTVSYKNLLKGHTYTLVAEVRNSEDGSLLASPEELTHFTIAAGTNANDIIQASGTQKVTFKFDPTDINVSSCVVYEYLYMGNFTNRASLDSSRLVAAHTDKNDARQTFNTKIPIEIEKRDRDTDTILGGAVFELQTADGTFVESWTSKAGQKHETSVLPGTYKLVEKVAPKGYTIAAPITFVVNSDRTITVNGVVLPDNTITMSDTRLAELPAAGGYGSTLFTILGIASMLSLPIYLRRRKED